MKNELTEFKVEYPERVAFMRMVTWKHRRMISH